MVSEPPRDIKVTGRAWAGLREEFPYAAIVVLSLIGVSWTSISRTPPTGYWIVLTPVFALICVVVGWRHTLRGERFAMAVTQILQWAAVLIAMYLIITTNATRSLEANATGLMLLTLLALGVFVSGVNMRSWKLCVTGSFLAVAVPLVAWVEEAALLLFLIAVVLLGLLFLYWWLRERRRSAEL